jgi:hypothetical protein
MELRKWAGLAAAAQLCVLAGCVSTVMAPTVAAIPGPGKLSADLASDQAACVSQTNQQMAAAVQAANNQVAGAALLNIMTGNNAATVNAQATSTLQQQFDNTYSACMYAKGEDVPPYYVHAEYTESTPAPRTRKRVVHKPSPQTQAPQAANSGFAVPAPSATPSGGGSGFVEPAPAAPSASSTAPPASSTQFVVPPATH